MKILYALVCEDAREREDGRVDVHGIYHQLHAPGFPAQQDRLMFALGIEWDEGELGDHELRIDLTDPSGSPALTISGGTEVLARTPGDAPPQTRILLPVEDIVFPAAGSYWFDLSIKGGAPIRLCPIHLIENESMPRTS